MFLNKIPVWRAVRRATNFNHQADVRIVWCESLLESSNRSDLIFSFKNTSRVTHHQEQELLFRQIEISPRETLTIPNFHHGRNMNYRNRTLERYCIMEKPGRRPYFVYQRKGV